MKTSQEFNRAGNDAMLAEALSWTGTPYRHQGSTKDVGCDCLGLIRGAWRAVYGAEPERPGAYAPDWAEAGSEDLFLAAARRHCTEKPAADAAPGDLLLFRWRPHQPAKHAGILVDRGHFIHAYQGHSVIISSLAPQWRRRIAAVFSFPETA
jgi:NlpC/P60 family putative phage cell wall peptidase